MKIHHRKINSIPFLKFDFKDGNRDMIFLHANAFPPECYIPMFKELGNEFNIICPLFRPLWNQPEDFTNLKTWTPLKEDTVDFLENYGKDKYIISGHSLGGHIGLRIALENKHLVEKMILLDPIIFPKLRIFIWQFIQWTEFGKNIHPMIKASKNQKLVHNSKIELISKYRKKKIFKNISDENLEYLINGFVMNRDDGKVEIKFPKEWELQIYQSGGISDKYIWKNIKNLTHDILLIHAGKTHLPEVKTIQKINSKTNYINTIYLKDNSHFFPFELPKKIAELTKKFINEELFNI